MKPLTVDLLLYPIYTWGYCVAELKEYPYWSSCYAQMLLRAFSLTKYIFSGSFLLFYS